MTAPKPYVARFIRPGHWVVFLRAPNDAPVIGYVDRNFGEWRAYLSGWYGAGDRDLGTKTDPFEAAALVYDAWKEQG